MSPATYPSLYLMAMTFLTQRSESKTVISIPFPTLSHVIYHSNVARVLASKDHQVCVAMPVYLIEKGHLNRTALCSIPYDIMPELEQSMRQVFSDCYFEGKEPSFFDIVKLGGEIVDVMLRNEALVSAIKQKVPDLVVIDNLPVFYGISIIPYRLGVPFAFLGSIYFPPMMRIPFSPADVPTSVFSYSNKMTFTQRLCTTLFSVIFTLYNPFLPLGAVSAYAPEMKHLTLDALVRQAEIFLVEHDHVLDYPKPTLPNVKLIGGTATGPAKALPPEFQSFMDSAKEGVVIVTFGSLVLHIPKHLNDKILQVLLQLPMKSVFRSDLTSPDPKKILTAPWIPQNDLLGHPHTKVFVSHCGKNGQYEALYHAVPTVCTPLFADQPYNAERARVKGLTEVLDLNTCTAEQMKSTILTVANEPRYKQAVVKRSRLFKELYGVPMETAAYWLDHVMEYGGEYMRSAGQQMPLYQYVLLDVVLFVMCVLILIMGLIRLFISALCTFLCKRKLKTE